MNQELRIKNKKRLVGWIFERIVLAKRNLALPEYSWRRQAGFTLVELIIYMGMLVILLGALSTIFVQAVDSQLETEATSSVEQDGRFMLTKLFYDINRASTIVSPGLGNSSSSLQIVVNGDTYTYASSSGKLQLTNSAGTDNVNGFDTTISNLSFTHYGNSGGQNTVRVRFTLTSNTIRQGVGREVRDYETTVGIRY